LKTKVVYTCLTGGYDGLLQHGYVASGWDYVCFSNDIREGSVGHWKIRRIDYESDDKQLLSRFPKLQPHEVLPEYDVSLYVDANVALNDDTVFKCIDELIENGTLLAGVKHQSRNCLYKESLFLILGGRAKNVSLTLQQMRNYKQEGFPRNFGMYEANIIFRQHNHPQIIQQCNDWWHERLNFSHRDQLSYSYTLWKNHLPWKYLLPEQYSARNYPGIYCPNHPGIDKHGWERRKNIYPKFILPLLHKMLFPIYYRFVL